MLTCTQVTKDYAGVRALCDVTLDVAPGERVALLGHNGAGKSTLMKIVLGLIPATSGRVTVAGAGPGSRTAREAAAYLPENAAFHPALTGREQIALYLRLRGEAAAKAGALLERVGLGAAADRRIGTYSKGMRQRVGLAQALIGRPRLMVLDEPTSGLDPVSRREFYAILDELARAGAAILLSSHALTEVEARTDRIAILSKGRLVANDTLGALRREAGLPIQIEVAARPGTVGEVAERLSGTRVNGVRVALHCGPDDKLARLGQIAGLGGLIEDVEVMPPSLEDLYTHFSRRAGE
ncbi:MAG: ABC transporter ATP-binding protein [Alphaproteobacteria bacterium HGW-Alphaproteobacteria-6]|nr:MAG: ABC transporter ATP-binding protein [Alphaproteobacteria bacterium HGW-Alphaproteobacteria-6]